MKYFLILVLFLTLTGCRKIPTKKELFENDYVSFKNRKHVFQKEDLNNALEILVKGSGIIVFAFNPNVRSCPYCDEALPIINEVAEELEIDKVFYVDIYMDRANNSYQYQLLYNYLTNLNNPNVGEEIALELIDNTKIIVPDVYVVKDGEVLAHHIALLKNEENQYIRNLMMFKKKKL